MLAAPAGLVPGLPLMHPTFYIRLPLTYVPPTGAVPLQADDTAFVTSSEGFIVRGRIGGARREGRGGQFEYGVEDLVCEEGS
jgi:hypothetical protein